MSLFRNIVFTSVLVGLVAGTAITAVQAVGTGNLIAQAEVYETAGEGAAHEHSSDNLSVSAVTAGEVHSHEHEGWEPANGLERTAFTLAANILTAIGYSLVLVSLMVFRGSQVGWRNGILWGLAAFTCVMLAPMLGLPPELPGTPSAPLADRQMWWMATAFLTACAIALAAFQRKPWAFVVALALVAAPHVFGAPQGPEGAHALAPKAMEQSFVAMAVLTSLILWSMIGALGATVYGRISR